MNKIYIYIGIAVIILGILWFIFKSDDKKIATEFVTKMTEQQITPYQFEQMSPEQIKQIRIETIDNFENMTLSQILILIENITNGNITCYKFKMLINRLIEAFETDKRLESKQEYLELLKTSLNEFDCVIYKDYYNIFINVINIIYMVIIGTKQCDDGKNELDTIIKNIENDQNMLTSILKTVNDKNLEDKKLTLEQLKEEIKKMRNYVTIQECELVNKQLQQAKSLVQYEIKKYTLLMVN